VYRNFSFLKALNIKIIIDTNTSAWIKIVRNKTFIHWKIDWSLLS
jgi:hypothetical protein